jgi:hypothetical protein
MPEQYRTISEEFLQKKFDIPATKSKKADNIEQLNEFLSENKFPLLDPKSRFKLSIKIKIKKIIIETNKINILF